MIRSRRTSRKRPFRETRKGTYLNFVLSEHYNNHHL
jgi:hypothetical protein